MNEYKKRTHTHAHACTRGHERTRTHTHIYITNCNRGQQRLVKASDVKSVGKPDTYRTRGEKLLGVANAELV